MLSASIQFISSLFFHGPDSHAPVPLNVTENTTSTDSFYRLILTLKHGLGVSISGAAQSCRYRSFFIDYS